MILQITLVIAVLALMILAAYLFNEEKDKTFSIHFDANPYKQGDIITNGNQKLKVIKSYPTRVVVKIIK